MSLAILDTGYGNTESVRLGFARLGAEPVLVRDADEAEKADRLVVPGVGNAGYAMERLEQAGLVETLRRRDRPTLGICVGMQLLFDRSEETDRPLLGILEGTVTALEPSPRRPVPHMGWSRLEDAEAATGLSDGDQLYFAHSFACPDSNATAARVTYGKTFPAAVRSGPWWGAQFHPERSSAAGTRFLEAFLTS